MLPEAHRNRLTAEQFDLLVIGGGIVGSGIVRDAAMRGLRVALVDRYDFAFGTSSRSSRLIHGGLRYLEQGHVRLVREASLEKKTLAHIVPHLTQPLGFVFPAYRGHGRPLWQLHVGVKLYDLLCSGRNLGASRRLSASQLMQQLPALNSDQLSGAVRYFDALTSDSRLVIDTLRSAEQHGAALANYTRFETARRSGMNWECDLIATSTDSDAKATEHRIQVAARAIVNAAGPWAQAIPHSRVKLRLSKGIHIVVDQSRLTTGDAVVITEGKRILFVIPWGGRTIVGTTDTDYSGPPEDVATEPIDVAYVLETLNRFFPSLTINQSDVVSHWAGLRPLIANPDGSPSDVSREHLISQSEPGWWDIAGGKLTTYRLMAEQMVDRIVSFIGKQARACSTAREPLLDASEVAYSSIVPPPISREAVEHFVQHEWSQHLSDVLLRRSNWQNYFGRDLADNQQRQIAEWMANVSNWSAQRIESELRMVAEAKS